MELGLKVREADVGGLSCVGSCESNESAVKVAKVEVEVMPNEK